MKLQIIAIATTLLIPVANANQEATPIGDLQRGSMVTVKGTVERITDEDEFRLVDATGAVQVYVGPNWVPANVGERVSVQGFVDNDWGPLEVYARSLVRADGTVFSFSHRYD